MLGGDRGAARSVLLYVSTDPTEPTTQLDPVTKRGQVPQTQTEQTQRIITFDSRHPLHLLRREIRYTLVRLQRRSFAAAWVPKFEKLLADTESSEVAYRKLLDAQEDTEADVDEADYALDEFVTRLVKLIRSELKDEALDAFSEALFDQEKPSDLV